MAEPLTTKEKMDSSATRAVQALDEMAADAGGLEELDAGSIVMWLFTWYMSAGYKRLCRHLFEVFGVRD